MSEGAMTPVQGQPTASTMHKLFGNVDWVTIRPRDGTWGRNGQPYLVQLEN
jgi:hypothetical protein